MARLVFPDGSEVRVVTVQTARARDVMELQSQTGMRLKDIGEMAQRNDVFGLAATSFLAQHNAGIFKKWEDLMNGGLEALGQIVLDKGDEERIAEEQADADPPDAQTPDAEDTKET